MTTWPGSPWSRPIDGCYAVRDDEGVKEGTVFTIETARLRIVEFTR